jgi:cell division protein FtsZ
MMKLANTNHTTPSQNHLVVRVVGIGGAGCASVKRLQEFAYGDLQVMAIDTGSASSNLGDSIVSLVLGNGFGSGGDSAVAVEQFGAAESTVQDFVYEADVVVILAGLGRGTGSGISPLIAEMARKSGALTIAAINMPFEFEGRFRNQSAARAHDQLMQSADAVITLNNDDLTGLGNAVGSLNGAFQRADQYVAEMVHSITSALNASSARFEAVKRSLQSPGNTLVLSGSGDGIHAGRIAVTNAFAETAPRLAAVVSVVIHVEGGIGLSLGQVAEAVTALREQIGGHAEIHVSSERRFAMGQGIKVTLLLGEGSRPVQSPVVTETPPLLTVTDERELLPSISIFDTPDPVRRRGPVLLPAS